MQIEENVLLAGITTFHIGGPARFFARATTLPELRQALVFAKEKNLSAFIFGGGSNLLVSDEGFDGLVIKIELPGIEFRAEGDRTLVIAYAGESWDGLVLQAVQQNVWGIENLSGIPGTVGGAVVQNIGAYGQALSQTLRWVEALDMQSGEVKQFSNAQCVFDYRDSFFKHDDGGHVIVRAAFALSSTFSPNVSYKDLKERLGAAVPTLSAIRDAVLEIRKAKFPDLSVEGTAGSFFKNPILSRVDAAALKKRHPEMPLFALPETSGVKIPLAYLFDKGLGLKNFSVGGARLFEKQPLVIVAARGTSSHEVETLAGNVQEKISNAYGIHIEPEVKML